MIHIRYEGGLIKNGLNIMGDLRHSFGFILRIGNFGWYVRWSRVVHRLFHEIDFNAFVETEAMHPAISPEFDKSIQDELDHPPASIMK